MPRRAASRRSERFRRASLPAVVIVDLMMPVMDGYGFVDAVRDDPRLARVPIMVLTASHGIDRTRLGKGTHVLTKPVSLADLVSTLDTIVLGIPGDLDTRQPGSNEADAEGALGIDSVQFASAQGVEPQFRLQSDGRLALREAVSESQEPSEEL